MAQIITMDFIIERYEDKDEVVAAMSLKRLLTAYAEQREQEHTRGKNMIYEMFLHESPRIQDDAWYYVDALNKFIVGDPMSRDNAVSQAIAFFNEYLPEIKEVSAKA